MRVLGRKAKGSREFVVDLVDVLVEKAVMHDTVSDVVPRVLHHEEEGDLRRVFSWELSRERRTRLTW